MKIIDFNDFKKQQEINLNEENLFELFLIFKYLTKDDFNVDLNLLMEALGKYSSHPRFHDIYKNINILINEEGRPYVNLLDAFNKFKKEKRIVEYKSQARLFCVIEPDTELELKKGKYDEHILALFDYLMFYISQDFTYGLDGWSLAFEDEYIEVPNYPGVVTGEFIGQKKDAKVIKKAKKMAINNLKN